jgi:hypothetical protein
MDRGGIAHPELAHGCFRKSIDQKNNQEWVVGLAPQSG